jgi:heptosyltransferase-2
MKILLIRFSSLGDIVLTSPVVRCIKKQLPNVELHYVTKASFRLLIADNPYIDKIHVLEKDESIFTLIKRLKSEKYDLVIDLHVKIRSLLISLMLATKTLRYHKDNVKKYALILFKKNYFKKEDNIVNRYFKAVSTIGVKSDGKGIDYFINPRDYVNIEDLPIPSQNGYVSYIIGASKFTKKLTLPKKIELLNQVQYPIILIGGKEDYSDGEDIIKYLPNKQIYNACGKYNFNQSAYIASKSKYIIGHDTGLTHIAAAFGKPIITILGSTSSAFGFVPYMADVILFENNQIPCRPCTRAGRDFCPRGHFDCMNKLDVTIPERLLA